MAMRNREDDGMITKVVSINRVSKTVKGGPDDAKRLENTAPDVLYWAQ